MCIRHKVAHFVFYAGLAMDWHKQYSVFKRSTTHLCVDNCYLLLAPALGGYHSTATYKDMVLLGMCCLLAQVYVGINRALAIFMLCLYESPGPDIWPSSVPAT